MGEEDPREAEALYEVSLVVPVYQGERTLEALADEVAPLTTPRATPGGRHFRVAELLLVHDGAVDRSALVMKGVAARHPFVRLVWLSRNYGQHPATLAGMASTVGEWVATLDEDGQQDPGDVGRLLDEALDHRTRLVYALPLNEPPHGLLRNRLSGLAKWISVRVLGSRIGAFNSFRLIEGEVARGVAAYCGANVYLDVALSWVVGEARHCPVALRTERGRPSGYTPRRLLRHFWQLVLTSGTRPLRLIALVGAASIVLGFAVSAFVVWQRLQHKVPVQGWTSIVIVTFLMAGLILVSLGIIAEYLGVAVSMAMGKPAYLIVSRPSEELGRKP
ncbi:MAG TPA: glycosyltransferase [Vicinamibacteria bacterium]|nr:glycosyltransferase [Vicinamibacteria bacterium]